MSGLVAEDTFRIVPDNAAYVPQEIWRALTDLDGSKLGASRREWYFPLPSYRDVMEQLKKNELLARSVAWAGKAAFASLFGCGPNR